jgi:hypothetical protein
MKHFKFAWTVLFLACAGFLPAQKVMPPDAGTYLTSLTVKETIKGVPVPKKLECVIQESSEDKLSLNLPRKNSNSTSFEHFGRVNSNVFALQNSRGEFPVPVKIFLALQGNDVVEVYHMSGNSVSSSFVIAGKGEKFKVLKKALKGHASEFDGAAQTKEVLALKAAAEAKAQEARMEKIKAAAAAEEKREEERAAKVQAAAEARANADLCTPLNRYFKLTSENFKSLEGKLDKEETEMEEVNVYFTNEVLELFRFGRVAPTWKEGVKELQFHTSNRRSKADAIAELEFIQGKLDACFKDKAGFKYNLDSGMHFYKSSTINMTLMTKTDFDDDLNTVYRVLLQVKKK